MTDDDARRIRTKLLAMASPLKTPKPTKETLNKLKIQTTVLSILQDVIGSIGRLELETTRTAPKEELANPEVEARSRKVFIRGVEGERRGGHSRLTEDISVDDLQNYFSQFGNVIKVDRKIREDSGKKRGYGSVEFDEEDAVDRIVLMGVHVIKGVRPCAKNRLNTIVKDKKTSGPEDFYHFWDSIDKLENRKCHQGSWMNC